jgi:hypothetical protein
VVARLAVDAFLEGRVDKVVLVYNEFRSVISQRVVVDQLLPIGRDEVRETTGPAEGGSPGDGYLPVEYLYEPSAQEIFNQLLPRYVEVQVYRALLESNAAFFRADDGDGYGDEELGRHDRQPDAIHEQGSPGGHHPRDHRSGVGGRGVIADSQEELRTENSELKT